MRGRLRDAATYPFRGPGWVRRLLWGGGTGLGLELLFILLGLFISGEATLGAAPLAVAVNFPILGYAAAVFQAALHARGSAPPAWEDWAGMTHQGLLVALVAVAYGALPTLLVLLGLGLMVQGGLFLSLGMVLVVLGALLGLLVGFFLPMGLARVFREGRVDLAFHLLQIWAGIDPVLADYSATYVICVVALLLAGLLASIPVVGALFWPFLAVQLLVAQARLFGLVCAKGG